MNCLRRSMPISRTSKRTKNLSRNGCTNAQPFASCAIITAGLSSATLNMNKKILYVYGGPEFHPTQKGGELLSQWLTQHGGYELVATNDLDMLTRLNSGTFSAVVLYATGFHDDLTPARAQGLLDFVRKGGGFVGIHAAADSFRGNRAFIEMLGCEFETHPEQHEFTVTIADKGHYLTTRVPDFSVYDEMYHLKSVDPNIHVLAHTHWQGKQMPMVYAKMFGTGRVTYLANGHTAQSWAHPEFRKLLVRAVKWSSGENLSDKVIRCAALGYGGAFNMGKGHLEWINATPGLQAVAMCDADPKRAEAARQDLPNLRSYFTSLDDLLAMPDLDLVVDILPHNLHAPTAIQCLQAGKHVVTEKPFCISVAEANAMIEAARSNSRMLSTFHNRRWDGDYLIIQDVLQRGMIGDIFRIECGTAAYNHPGFWWRADKTISGGVMHDWGAHFIDWILGLVPSKIAQVTGDFQKRVWNAVTNEDHGQAWIRFENGVTVDLLVSSISALPRTKWRIFGTKGAIETDWKEEVRVVSYASGIRHDGTIKVTLPGYGSTQYYRNIADHLLLSEPLEVRPEQARRVIAIIEAAMQSATLGHSVPVAAGCE